MQIILIQMSNFSDRLKEERKRLGLNQDDFAALGGVKKGAQFNYENGSRAPDSDYLAAIAAAGVDTQYLLLGIPSIEGLTDDEGELLAAYRHLDLRAKARVLGVVEGAGGATAPATTPKNRSTATFHGSVGQQITGDITAPQTINVGRKKK